MVSEEIPQLTFLTKLYSSKIVHKRHDHCEIDIIIVNSTYQAISMVGNIMAWKEQ